MSTSPFGDLAVLRQTPVPDMKPVRARLRSPRRPPPDPADARFNEPLVNIAELGVSGASYYAGSRNPPYYHPAPGAVAEVLVREGVGRLLTQVNARIAPVGLELFLFDGWRPTEVQAYFHDQWLPAEMRRRLPDLAERHLRREVGKYWAAPSTDPAAPAPHNTGGAVDLTLRWRDTGEALWMGSLFDDASAVANLDHFEKRLAGPSRMAFSDEEARANRRLLCHLMTGVGFALNPFEWWHYGYGERMWAQLNRAPFAFYGPTRP
jgi:D-alanyl-D-alanine dipeptidase